MVDNIKVRPGTGTRALDVATDDIGGVHYPVYKTSFGTDGSVTQVDNNNPLPVGIYGSNGNLAYVDQFTGAVGTIDQEHLQIHNGNVFTVGNRFTIANVGGIVEFLGIVPNGAFPHFRTMVITLDGGPFDVDFYEGTTVSANGTAVTAFNNNRNSSNTADLEIYEAPTITADGTLLEPVLALGSRQTGAIGTDTANEWILKTNEKYMIRVTNNTTGAGTARATVNMFWYE